MPARMQQGRTSPARSIIQKPNAIKSVTVPMIFSFARRVMPCPCTKDSKLSL